MNIYITGMNILKNYLQQKVWLFGQRYHYVVMYFLRVVMLINMKLLLNKVKRMGTWQCLLNILIRYYHLNILKYSNDSTMKSKIWVYCASLLFIYCLLLMYWVQLLKYLWGQWYRDEYLSLLCQSVWVLFFASIRSLSQDAHRQWRVAGQLSIVHQVSSII